MGKKEKKSLKEFEFSICPGQKGKVMCRLKNLSTVFVFLKFSHFIYGVYLVYFSVVRV